MKEKIKEILEKQLELLSEKSQFTNDIEILCRLSREMAELTGKLVLFL